MLVILLWLTMAGARGARGLSEGEVTSTEATTSPSDDPSDVAELISALSRISPARGRPGEALYDAAVRHVQTLTALVRDEERARQFVQQHGLEVVVPHLAAVHSELTAELLRLLLAAVTSHPAPRPALPSAVYDNTAKVLLTSFDADAKQAALDVLRATLPENPAGQARIMAVSGLEPFYKMMKKERPQLVAQILDLFNEMIEEHVRVRGGGDDDAEGGDGTLSGDEVLYRRIGLIERLGTPEVCNGLLDVIMNVWRPEWAAREVSLTASLFRILTTVKRHCLPVFRRRRALVKVFQNMVDTLKSPYLRDELTQLYPDLDEILAVLADYADDSKVRRVIKDEEL